MANVFKTVNGKILLTAPGSGKIANECCCETCETCCENPWVFCFTVNDGGSTPLYAYASISITTTKSGCCCTGWANGTLYRSSDGATLGYVTMELVVTHDGCFARFTVCSASYTTCGTCPPGCPSAWVKGTLTGTVPSACELTFAATIARSGTTPLNVEAADFPCTFEYERCVENLVMTTYEYEKCVENLVMTTYEYEKCVKP